MFQDIPGGSQGYGPNGCGEESQGQRGDRTGCGDVELGGSVLTKMH